MAREGGLWPLPTKTRPEPSGEFGRIGSGPDMYHIPVAAYQHVFGKAKYMVVPELLSCTSPIPRRPRSTAPRRRRATPSLRIEGNSMGEGISFESPSATSSKRPPCATRKRRKTEVKAQDESMDSEVTVVQRARSRGQAVRPHNTNIEGRGMLDSGTFLQYFRHIWSSFPEEKVNSMAYFDPLWFCLYADQRNRNMDLAWIKKMEIFSKKYVFVPIVIWSHWSLLIFCHLGESLSSKTSTPCMLLLDSLHGIGPKRLEPLVRRLLLDIYKAEERPEDKKQLTSMPFLTPQVPQQRKGDECGFYVLHYINLFLEAAPSNFSVSEGYPYFMKKDWFNSEAMESFYTKLPTFPIASTDIISEDDSDSPVYVETVRDKPSNTVR